VDGTGTPAVEWLEAARRLRWDTFPTAACADPLALVARWFPDGLLNTCFNALDRHVAAGHGARAALVHVSAYTGKTRRTTYAALLEDVRRFAGALRARGIGRGDRVVLYLPLIPEAVVAMLACARLGAVHSVVFGGFSAVELAKRIADAEPALLVTASAGLEPNRVVPYLPIVREALSRAHRAGLPTVVVQRDGLEEPLAEHEASWADVVRDAPRADCVSVPSEHPLYILYTSGTTGVPKGIVRDHGGHAVALLHSLATVYLAQPSDVYWAASDVGWVVGHSYLVYGPLLLGATTVMYEGKPVGTPDAGAYWRVVRDVGVDLLFTAPTAIRAIRREDPDGTLWRSVGSTRLRAVFLAGERADPATVTWVERTLGVPAIDHWWQTELGWPALAASLDGPRSPGCAGRPVPGFEAAVVDAAGAAVPAGTPGHLVLRAPLPPGCLVELWRRPDGLADTYLSRFPGWYATGDAAVVDAAGQYSVLGRTDDLINVAGHRLSTGRMEEVVASHPDVAECAVVGVPDPIKGEVPVAFAVMRAGAASSEQELARALVACIRDQIGPVAALKRVIVVERLPKTRSGKLLRRSLRAVLAGEPLVIPPTIEDAAVLESLAQRLHVPDHPEGTR
jgi:propionyl-CoA synthetase